MFVIYEQIKKTAQLEGRAVFFCKEKDINDASNQGASF
jgi:hypothetical protein